ncbi:Glutaredoxin [Thalictrum thalictroides]|nr:Glutaredoxin [Thalictrum thalictroides]
MDPNVVSSFRKAESSRKSGFNLLNKTKSSVYDAKVSPLFEYNVELPGTEDRIVIYFTSLRGIRRTYEDCCVVRTIFKGLRVPVDERDISMDSAYRNELQCALDKNKVALSLPQVFVKGKYLGGVEKVKQLHEDGELAKFVEGFPVQDPGFVCENCGDARFVPCSNCNGSRKVYMEEEGQLRRCSNCNENGLIRCPSCCS